MLLACNSCSTPRGSKTSNDGTMGLRSSLISKRFENLDLESGSGKSRSSLPSPDEPDHPHLPPANSKVLEAMKCELNRLNSFVDKWPLSFVRHEELAENGFFYLQTDDMVQCAFCKAVLGDWKTGDKPLKEHMKVSPKCPLLIGSSVGNVTMSQQERRKAMSRATTSPIDVPKQFRRMNSDNNSESHGPKKPSMADPRKRLMSYRSWPLVSLSPQNLAVCGLYYTGVADVVTCFFCGGSLGNWEPSDDPWREHEKFFPSCGFLQLVKHHGQYNLSPTLQSTQENPTSLSTQVPEGVSAGGSSGADLVSEEIVRQACDIFPPRMVQELVLRHMRDSGRSFTSLDELCHCMLEEANEGSGRSSKEVVHAATAREKPKDETAVQLATETPLAPPADPPKPVVDALLCRICMDREMGVVFQPCGHLVSCPTCALLLYDCPLCRRPIVSKVRTYLS